MSSCRVTCDGVVMTDHSIFIASFSVPALYSVAFLFLRRQPLSWSQSQYGIFVGYGRMLSGVFSLFFIPLLKHYVDAKDTVLLILGLLSSCASELYFAFCVLTWMVFLGKSTICEWNSFHIFTFLHWLENKWIKTWSIFAFSSTHEHWEMGL